MRTPQAREKARQARAESKKYRASQAIPISDKWRIVRKDEYNWEIQHKKEGKWTFFGYYGNLVDAFKDLARKMLNKVATGDISDVLAQQREINRTIEQALNLKLA